MFVYFLNKYSGAAPNLYPTTQKRTGERGRNGGGGGGSFGPFKPTPIDGIPPVDTSPSFVVVVVVDDSAFGLVLFTIGYLLLVIVLMSFFCFLLPLRPHFRFTFVKTHKHNMLLLLSLPVVSVPLTYFLITIDRLID